MTAEQVQELKRAIEDYWQAGYNMGCSMDLAEFEEKRVPNETAKAKINTLLEQYAGHEVR